MGGGWVSNVVAGGEKSAETTAFCTETGITAQGRASRFQSQFEILFSSFIFISIPVGQRMKMKKETNSGKAHSYSGSVLIWI